MIFLDDKKVHEHTQNKSCSQMDGTPICTQMGRNRRAICHVGLPIDKRMKGGSKGRREERAKEENFFGQVTYINLKVQTNIKFMVEAIFEIHRKSLTLAKYRE